MTTFQEQTNTAISAHLVKQDPVVIVALLPIRPWHREWGDAPFCLPAQTARFLN